MVSIFAIISYTLASYFNRSPTKSSIGLNSHYLWATIGIILHLLIINEQIITEDNLIFSFINSLMIAGFFIGLFTLITTAIYPIFILRKIVYIIIIASLLVNLLPIEQQQKSISTELGIHIVLSMGAYAILFLCFIQSILLKIQDKALRRQNHYQFRQDLLPLETMEMLLLLGLITGTALLTLSLLSGFIFLSDIFAQHLVHKTVLSIIAWLILIIILISHVIFGFRGKQLIKLVWISFGFLIVAYFGSLFILEYIVGY